MNTSFEVLPFGSSASEAELERHSMRPGKHLSFRGRQARRRAIPSPWPYYYGYTAGPTYGPGWPAALATAAAPIIDSDAVDDPQRELGGCNCPQCRQGATAFEVLPFG